jgi:hypothetical protein
VAPRKREVKAEDKVEKLFSKSVAAGTTMTPACLVSTEEALKKELI